jgi:hypothetical protein
MSELDSKACYNAFEEITRAGDSEQEQPREAA